MRVERGRWWRTSRHQARRVTAREEATESALHTFRTKGIAISTDDLPWRTSQRRVYETVVFQPPSEAYVPNGQSDDAVATTEDVQARMNDQLRRYRELAARNALTPEWRAFAQKHSSELAQLIITSPTAASKK